MTYCRITGCRFELKRGEWMGTVYKVLFNAAVLIPQGYLQMQDGFTVTLKSEMSRFNYTCMNRPDCDLMYLISRYTEKFCFAY